MKPGSNIVHAVLVRTWRCRTVTRHMLHALHALHESPCDALLCRCAAALQYDTIYRTMMQLAYAEAESWRVPCNNLVELGMVLFL